MDALIIRMDNPIKPPRIGPEKMFHRHLHLNDSGHFVNMPDHCAQRTRPMDYLFIWVLHGRGYVETEGRRYAARPGDLLTFAPGKAHRYGAAEIDPWDILWIHFHGSLARSFVTAIRRGRGARIELGLDAQLRDRWIDLVIA